MTNNPTAIERAEDVPAHTPTPWECDWGTIPPDGPGTYCDVYVDGGDTIIARVNDCIKSGHANAAFIVKAVNNHDALVKALGNIAQRANESGTGTLALIETIHAMHRIARETLIAVASRDVHAASFNAEERG